jgi:hypothetical protein
VRRDDDACVAPTLIFFQSSVASNSGPLRQDAAQAALIGTPTPSRISAADTKKG